MSTASNMGEAFRKSSRHEALHSPTSKSVDSSTAVRFGNKKWLNKESFRERKTNLSILIDPLKMGSGEKVETSGRPRESEIVGEMIARVRRSRSRPEVDSENVIMSCQWFRMNSRDLIC